jgi:hypothetical protein
VRRELGQVGRDLPVGHDRTQEAEHAARPERVPDRLVHAVAARDLHVVAEGLHATHLERDDHVVGARECGPPVGAALHRGREAVVRDERARGGRRALQPTGVDVHQRERAAAQRGVAQQVTDQPEREDVPAGTDDSDLGHADHRRS